MLYPAELRGPGRLHIGLDTCCPSMFHELAALRPKKPAIMRLQQGRWGRLNIAAPERSIDLSAYTKVDLITRFAHGYLRTDFARG